MTPQFEAARIKRAMLITLLLNFTLGVVNATWVSRIPAIRDALSLQPSEIGLILLMGSVGSLIALPTTGPLTNRIGTAVAARIGSTVWAAGLTGMGLSVLMVSRPTMVGSLVLLCFGLSMWAGSQNIEVGYQEAASLRPHQFRFHAFYSIGTVVGALVSAFAIRQGLPTPIHMFVVAGIGLVAVWVCTTFFLPKAFADSFAITAEGGERVKGRTRRAWRERRTVLIAVMVLAAGMCEGSANDWLALSMVDGYGMDQGHASMVLSLFLAVMATVRLSSGLLLRRWPVDRLLASLLGGGIMGLLMVAFSPGIPLALLGVVLWAAGAALIFPSASSALSEDPSMTAARLSVLSTINYGSALVGPPVLGMIAEHIGYHRTLAVLVIPVAIGICLTPQLRRPQSEQQPTVS